MDELIVAPKKFILKMNIHCKGCGKKLKKFIKKIHGVNTVAIDAETGKVTISATIDPEMVINALHQKAGRKAELFWEEEEPSPLIIPILKKPNIPQPKPVQVIDHQQMVTQLQGFSDMKDLKKVEITYSVKLSFKDNKDGFKDKEQEIVKVKSANSYHGSCCGLTDDHKTSDCFHGYDQGQGIHENSCRQYNPRMICGCQTHGGGDAARGYSYVPLQPPWTSNIPSAPPLSREYFPLQGAQSSWTSSVPSAPQVVCAYPGTFFNTLHSDDSNSKSCSIL